MNGIVHLESTPQILRALLSGITEEDATWKPVPDRWSVAEVLEHLSHVEGHCFRARIDLSMEKDGAAWESYDQKAYEAAGAYSGRTAEDSFDHFEEQREDNLDCLTSLEESAAARKGVHPEMGEITLAELVAQWAFHDLGHIRQIAELIRARRYYAEMGPFRTQYEIHP